MLAGSWEERLPAGAREAGTVAAAALAVAGARGSSAFTTAARCRRSESLVVSMAKSLLETPWAVAIDPARRDGRIVAESSEPERRQSRWRCRARSTGAWSRRSAGRGSSGSLASARGAESGRGLQPGAHAAGTASGKSLAFNLPVLDGIARDAKRRALYLYPTKALAQDQARKLAALRPPNLREAIYDGDTPREERPAIRRRNNLVLTNPDMLHVGLLPNHKSWGDFIANLGWVVVDEAHTYRGVFGSHVANVLRRLRRVARAYGAEPRFLLASARLPRSVCPSWPSGWSASRSS